MALTKPFAENGNKTAIPATTNDGSVSYDQGFGSFYALPPEEGGLFIDRAQFNQLMYDTTSAIISNQNSITRINNKFSSLETGGGSIVTVKPANITLTVGTGGMFSTLESAWVEAKKYLGIVEIKLVSNISNNRNIIFSSTNAKNIRFNFNGFTLENTSSTIYLFDFAACTIDSIINLSLKGYVLHVINGSSIFLINSVTIDLSGYPTSQDCIRAWHQSFIGAADNTTFTLTRTTNRSSIYSSIGSIIGIGGGSTINDNSTDGRVLNAYRGGIIQVTGVTINTSIPISNQAANTPTYNGIIFGNYSL